MTTGPTTETEYDQITLVCTKCKAEYTTFPLKPLRTSEIQGWLSTNVLRFCDCDVATCNVKLRIKGSKAAP